VRGARGDSRRLWCLGLAVLLPLLPALVACGARPRATESFPPAATSRGYKALFRVESQGPEGKSRFKMAVALLAPDRVRLEFLGPAGGPRLTVATDGEGVTALLPSERAFDRAEASPATMERLIGLPLDGARTISLLTGTPMCHSETAEQVMRTKGAATFGRTLAWYEVVCPPGEIRYQATAAERGGVLKDATVRDGTSGAMILQVEYGDHEEGLGPRWPRRIRLRMERARATVTLSALEGPEADDVPEAIFSPPIPEGFERRSLFVSLAAPGLLGSTAGKER